MHAKAQRKFFKFFVNLIFVGANTVMVLDGYFF